MTRLILVFLVLFYANCTGSKQNQESNKQIAIDSIPKKFRADIHEIKLGESNYFILLPDKFKMSEARGKEGQLGYNIIPKDTASTMFGFIEIRHGNPIGGTSSDESLPKEIISSYLLDKKVEWEIYRPEPEYFEAFTNEKGDLNAHASSKYRNEIDSLVSIISTLRQK